MAKRFTFDKRRAEQYRRWTGGGPAEELAQALRTSAGAPAAVGAPQWTSIGPTNIGGRLTCIAVDPTDARHLWVGAAGGGVWETKDGGNSWHTSWKNRETTLVIGSLVVDPDDAKVLYCGTGEANMSGDSDPGVGVFRSGDGGASWNPAGSSTDPDVPLPRRIGSMALGAGPGSTAPKTVWLAGIRNDDSEPPGGIYSSSDEGSTWKRHDLFGPKEPYQAHAVLARGDDAVAGVTAEWGAVEARSGIWLSRNGGGDWSQVWSPGPNLEIARIALARAPSDAGIVYALVAGADGLVADFLRSDNGGGVFESRWLDPYGEENIMTYNCTLAVHPTDAERVIWGGVDLHRSEHGGRGFERATDWTNPRGHMYYAHADHHALVWVDDGSNGILYDANDGGLDVSTDRGFTFENRSKKLAVTQFYDVEVAGTKGEIVGGGTQDNGTVFCPDHGAAEFETLERGDGGWLALDSSTNDPYRWVAPSLTAGGFNVTVRRGSRETARRRFFPEPDLPFSFWVVPAEVHPSRKDVVFVASDKIYLSVDFGGDWEAVTGSLDAQPIVAIRSSPADPDRIYAASEGGRVFRSVDGGFTWSYDLVGDRFEGAGVAGLVCSGRAADELYVCLAGFAGASSRIRRSTDGGWSWKEVPETGLPDLPLTSIVLAEPDGGDDFLAVAGSAGVWKAATGGGPFSDVTGDLPNVRVTDLVYHPPSGTWTAATYGRGLWRTAHL